MALLTQADARTLNTPSAAGGFPHGGVLTLVSPPGRYERAWWATVATVTPSTTPPRPGAGDQAPDFTLRHTFTEQVTLADRLRRGPVVLAFYVFDFGSV
jgi:AhpC/TSA family